MADFEESLSQVPGLAQALGGYSVARKLRLQSQFDQDRAALGDNPNPDAAAALGIKYSQDPTALMHWGLASQDRKAALAATLLHHNQLIDVARERNDIMRENNLARVKDKEAQDAIMNGFRERDRQLAEQRVQNDKILKELGLNIAQQRAGTAQQAVEQRGNKLDEPLLNMLDKIDATTRMIQNNPEAVGGRGMLNRGMEFVGGMLNPGQDTPASNLQSQILDLQTTYRGLPGHAASRLKIDAANIDNLIKGLGTFTAPDQALNSLATLRATIAKQLERRGGTPAAPAAAIPVAPREAKERQPNTVYQTPRGPLKWTGTGWVPVE